MATPQGSPKALQPLALSSRSVHEAARERGTSERLRQRVLQCEDTIAGLHIEVTQAKAEAYAATRRLQIERATFHTTQASTIERQLLDIGREVERCRKLAVTPGQAALPQIPPIHENYCLRCLRELESGRHAPTGGRTDAAEEPREDHLHPDAQGGVAAHHQAPFVLTKLLAVTRTQLRDEAGAADARELRLQEAEGHIRQLHGIVERLRRAPLAVSEGAGHRPTAPPAGATGAGGAGISVPPHELNSMLAATGWLRYSLGNITAAVSAGREAMMSSSAALNVAVQKAVRGVSDAEESTAAFASSLQGFVQRLAPLMEAVRSRHPNRRALPAVPRVTPSGRIAAGEKMPLSPLKEKGAQQQQARSRGGAKRRGGGDANPDGDAVGPAAGGEGGGPEAEAADDEGADLWASSGGMILAAYQGWLEVYLIHEVRGREVKRGAVQEQQPQQGAAAAAFARRASIAPRGPPPAAAGVGVGRAVGHEPHPPPPPQQLQQQQQRCASGSPVLPPPQGAAAVVHVRSLSPPSALVSSLNLDSESDLRRLQDCGEGTDSCDAEFADAATNTAILLQKAVQATPQGAAAATASQPIDFQRLVDRRGRAVACQTCNATHGDVASQTHAAPTTTTACGTRDGARHAGCQVDMREAVAEDATSTTTSFFLRASRDDARHSKAYSYKYVIDFEDSCSEDDDDKESAAPAFSAEAVASLGRKIDALQERLQMKTALLRHHLESADRLRDDLRSGREEVSSVARARDGVRQALEADSNRRRINTARGECRPLSDVPGGVGVGNGFPPPPVFSVVPASHAHPLLDVSGAVRALPSFKASTSRGPSWGLCTERPAGGAGGGGGATRPLWQAPPVTAGGTSQSGRAGQRRQHEVKFPTLRL